MTDKSDKNKTSDPTAPVVAFDYIKTGAFRSVRADGAIGGITPNGQVHVAFFSERHAIPKRVIQELKADGTLGEIREVHSKNSVVREMDVDVFMTLDAAIVFHNWLGELIEEHQKELKE